MEGEDREEALLRSVALQNSQSILAARQRAEQELVRAKEALRKQSEWLRITLASIGDAVIATDAEGRVTFLNGVAEALTGWGRADAEGRPLPEVFRIVNEHTRRPADNPALRALREGAVVGLANHTVLIARDGTERPIDDSAAPMRDDAGAAVGAVLVFRDVTERKRADDARARLAAIVESSEDAVVSKTLDGIIQTWNAGAERLFGHAPAEAVGRHITLIIPPERHDEERVILDRLRRGERVEHFETVRVAKDGRLVDVSLTVSPVRDAAGRVVGASKVARDVTERKRAEAALRESEGRHRFLADLAQATQPLTEPAEFMATAARMLAEHLGVDRCAYAEVEDESVFVITGDYPVGVPSIVGRWPVADFGAECARLMRANEPYVVEDVDADPRVGPADLPAYRATTIAAVICVPLHKDGKLTSAMAVHQKAPRRWSPDEVRLVTTVVARCWEALERARVLRALRESDRQKDEFIALLAHELRNPLAPLRNGLQVIRLAGGDANAVAQARAMMERQLGHMVRLIDDLLDVSRIGQNKMRLRRARVLLADAVGAAVETARPAVEAAGHELTVALPPGPVYLDADLTRLAQVFSNLLTNSAKYTERGGRIWLAAERRGGDVVVSVRDTGIGIPPEALPRVFDMFSQVDRSMERSTGGLGIGLALVKGLVEMHGGTVAAASAGQGRGSTFTVTLPALGAQAGSSSAVPAEGGPAAGPRRRVLVVDDNRDAATSMAMMLKLLGNDVRTAHDGVEAVEAAEQFRPQVVLMDVGMPRLNGLDATRRIRAQAWGMGMAVIALTGWGQDADRAESKAAGCDGHLVKPVHLPDLEKLVAELVGDRPLTS